MQVADDSSFVICGSLCNVLFILICINMGILEYPSICRNYYGDAFLLFNIYFLYESVTSKRLSTQNNILCYRFYCITFHINSLKEIKHPNNKLIYTRSSSRNNNHSCNLYNNIITIIIITESFV